MQEPRRDGKLPLKLSSLLGEPSDFSVVFSDTKTSEKYATFLQPFTPLCHLPFFDFRANTSHSKRATGEFVEAIYVDMATLASAVVVKRGTP